MAFFVGFNSSNKRRLVFRTAAGFATWIFSSQVGIIYFDPAQENRVLLLFNRRAFETLGPATLF